MTYANGDVFSGNYLEGKKHGKGEFRTLAGDSYIGEWADDVPQGLGEMFYSNGLIYNGNWENGLVWLLFPFLRFPLAGLFIKSQNRDTTMVF